MVDTKDTASFFGGSINEPNPLPLCPVCGFNRLISDERDAGMCSWCSEDAAKCRECARPVGDYESTAKDAKVVPAEQLCEQCHGELVSAALRQRRIDDEDGRGDYLRDQQRGAL